MFDIVNLLAAWSERMTTVVQDSVQFNLETEEVVVNTTVKVVAQVTAVLTSNLTEATLRESINDTMQRFIKADWQFANMIRSNQRSGVEQVDLTASARVPESENYNLDRRREQASREGLRIHSVSTDTSPTVQQIEGTQSKMRRILLEKAVREQAAINETLQADYRLGEVVFDPNDESPRMTMANRAQYGSGFVAQAASAEAGPIGNAVKLNMTARVTLRIKR